MTHTLFKVLLVAGLIVLLITPVHADVSYEGYYIALAFILGVLFLPVFIVALARRTRKKIYLTALILWAVAAFAYIWFTGGRQNEFFLISSVSYIILGVYFFKEKKLAKAR
jgi:Na+/melibiose symporter-like transporter